MNHQNLLIGWMILLLIACTGMLQAAEDADTPKAELVDPSGTWKWEYSFNDEPAEFQLKLNWDGKQLTGKYTAFNLTSDVDGGKLDKDELSFMSKREFNGNPFTVQFKGQVEPNDIVGTFAVDFGDGPREFDWHAKRTADVKNVLGTWRLRLETPQGVIEPQITITEVEGKLQGAYASPFGERHAQDLVFQDSDLSWKIASDQEDDFDFEVVYRGKPSDDKIKGSAEFNFGGNSGTMVFTGERTPPTQSDSVVGDQK